ncbi:sigma-70 family RNA polymerase sigma factor [Vibrio rumoiensis]|uniref:sigma-70 family RNA polymerase sigma factor n=1 Tax=Vibrio rumoiensis TaxID=76258 RepID=UPI003AA97619
MFSNLGYQRTPLLSKNEELAIESKAINEALPLIRNIVWQHTKVLSSFEREEINQVATIAFLLELRKFNHQVGKQFYKAASIRVRGEVIDELRRRDPMLRDSRKQLNIVKKTKATLSQTLGREPTLLELSAQLNLTIDELQDLTTSDVQHDDLDLFEVVAGGGLEATMERSQIVEKIAELLKSLPEVVQKVFFLMYMEGFSTTETAQALKITRHQVHTAKTTGIKLIQSRLKESVS